MTLTAEITPVPPLVFMPLQSSRTSAPIPASTEIPSSSAESQMADAQKPETDSSKKHVFPLPKLRLELRDLNHPGSHNFLAAVNASEALQTSVQSVLLLLYLSPDYPTTTVPTTRSVTLVLRQMDGVAYTTGSDLDSDHKEIHFNLEYIHNIAKSRKTDEIMGVLTHEMVHCYQYDAFQTCPGGLVEGIADWVRLNSNLSPPHWKQEATGKWDAGYQTTAYFLEYLEQRFGKGTVRKLNEKLRIERYQEKRFWTELCGRPVEQLWNDYAKTLEKDPKKMDDDECVLVEKADASSPKAEDTP